MVIHNFFLTNFKEEEEEKGETICCILRISSSCWYSFAAAAFLCADVIFFGCIQFVVLLWYEKLYTKMRFRTFPNFPPWNLSNSFLTLSFFLGTKHLKGTHYKDWNWERQKGMVWHKYVMNVCEFGGRKMTNIPEKEREKVLWLWYVNGVSRRKGLKWTTETDWYRYDTCNGCILQFNNAIYHFAISTTS